jgi:hypothetical protein
MGAAAETSVRVATIDAVATVIAAKRERGEGIILLPLYAGGLTS